MISKIAGADLFKIEQKNIIFVLKSEKRFTDKC